MPLRVVAALVANVFRQRVSLTATPRGTDALAPLARVFDGSSFDSSPDGRMPQVVFCHVLT